MTRVVLARHGETLWHAENRYAGVSDVPLTLRGRQQAAFLANWAGAAGLDAVWASPLSRSRQTAAVCAKVCDLSVRVDERLREVDFGAGEGLTTGEMAARFPAALQAFRENPVAHHLPGGEHPVDAAARFVAALQDFSVERP
ncbi:MAG TPA: histidine phosphatase family protein, partial [Nakamurella sp.]